MPTENQQPDYSENQASSSNSKGETIELLTETIQQLEAIISQIQRESDVNIPPIASIRAINTQTKNLAAITQSTDSQVKGSSVESYQRQKKKNQDIGWFGKITSFLSNRVVIGILIVLLLISISIYFLSGKLGFNLSKKPEIIETPEVN